MNIQCGQVAPVLRLLRGKKLGQSKVEDLDAPILGYEDVVGLEVAMDEAMIVSGGKAPRDLDTVLDRLADRQRAATKALAQGFALEQFGNDVRRTVVRPNVVNRKNVGMIQTRRGARLLLEAPLAVRVIGKVRGQNLYRDIAAQTGIPGAVHLTHSSGADWPNHFVWADVRPASNAHLLSSALRVRTGISDLDPWLAHRTLTPALDSRNLPSEQALARSAGFGPLVFPSDEPRLLPRNRFLSHGHDPKFQRLSSNWKSGVESSPRQKGATTNMASQEPQNFQNHTRVVPLYHQFVLSVFVINLGWTIYRLVKDVFSWGSIVNVLVPMA